MVNPIPLVWWLVKLMKSPWKRPVNLMVPRSGRGRSGSRVGPGQGSSPTRSLAIPSWPCARRVCPGNGLWRLRTSLAEPWMDETCFFLGQSDVPKIPIDEHIEGMCWNDPIIIIIIIITTGQWWCRWFFHLFSVFFRPKALFFPFRTLDFRAQISWWCLFFSSSQW